MGESLERLRSAPLKVEYHFFSSSNVLLFRYQRLDVQNPLGFRFGFLFRRFPLLEIADSKKVIHAAVVGFYWLSGLQAIENI